MATFPVALCQVSYWFSKESQGTVLGVVGGVSELAPGLVSCLLPLTFRKIGIAKAYFTWVGLLILGTLSYYVIGLDSWYYQLLDMGFSQKDARMLAEERGQELYPMGDTWLDIRTAAANWKTWAIGSVYFCAFGGQVAVLGFLPLYCEEQLELSPQTGGILTGWLTIVAATARSVSGPLNAHLGGESAITVFFTVATIAALLIAVSRLLLLSIMALVILALSFGVCSNAAFKLVPQDVSDAVGGGIGIVSGMGCFGGFVQGPAMALFPRVLGKGGNGYAWGFLVIATLTSVNIWVSRKLLRYANDTKNRSLVLGG